ncbi:hypothetical protein [Neorickettsia sp. 179522]|uniref:hypothetical protein n=1 Tax=Neorickettsia sp. 179522 TaxID=1714371 RepID=UPI000794A03D|nr:hypothetical protein [Neorickettsia sp. 179522]KYH12279.1 hypothetical protein AS219_00395 [Neorickettsia sp. 179522]
MTEAIKGTIIACVVVALLIVSAILLYWLCKRRAALRAAEEEETKKLLPEESPVPCLEEVKVGTLAALEGCFSTDGILDAEGTKPDLKGDVVIVEMRPGLSSFETYQSYALYHALGIVGAPIDKSAPVTTNNVQVFCGPRGRTPEGHRWILMHVLHPEFWRVYAGGRGARAITRDLAGALSSEDFARCVQREVRRHWGDGAPFTVEVDSMFVDFNEQIRYFAKGLASQPGVEERGILPHMNAPVKVCCYAQNMCNAALEGVRDAVRERSQDVSSQGARR